MRWTLQLALGLLFLLAALNGAAAQVEAGDGLSDDQIVERVLELRRELDALLAALPADLRDEIERRLAAADPSEAPGPPEAIASLESALSSGSEAVATSPDFAAAAVEAIPATSATPTAPAISATPAADSCAELAVFDTNGDGAVSGFDRYWRLFRLWRDDGDGKIEPPEIFGLYDAEVREFSSSLRRYETLDGVRGEVLLVGGWVTFELMGKKGGPATLMVDAERLSRGGELTLVDADGAALGGLHRLGEMSMLSAGGEITRLSCP